MSPIEWMEILSNSQGVPYNCIGMLVRPMMVAHTHSHNHSQDITDFAHFPAFTVVLLNRNKVNQQQENGFGKMGAVAISCDKATGIFLQPYEYRVIWDDGKFV